MIDIVKAENEFKKFLENYDINDEKVILKVTHTYGVVDASEKLAKALKLNEEDAKLSKLIALLHDIGRFEQTKSNIKIYDRADSNLFDHAEYGVKILFEDGLIRNFIEDDSYDNIIYKAIKNHNKLKIEDGLNEKELLHAKLIRDNDKTDNFRVKSAETFKVLLGTDDTQEIFASKVTDKIYSEFMNENLINTADVQTHLDRWMGYMAFIFDYNFAEGLKYLNDNDMVNSCFNRMKCTDLESKEKLINMKSVANNYINKRIQTINE